MLNIFELKILFLGNLDGKNETIKSILVYYHGKAFFAAAAVVGWIKKSDMFWMSSAVQQNVNNSSCLTTFVLDGWSVDACFAKQKTSSILIRRVFSKRLHQLFIYDEWTIQSTEN